MQVSEQIDVLVMRLILQSRVARQARVGDHSLAMGRFAWTLLLAVLFMECQCFPCDLQRLWKDGFHLDRLCCERVLCWGVVPGDGGAWTALRAAKAATLWNVQSAWLRASCWSRPPNRLRLSWRLSSSALGSGALPNLDDVAVRIAHVATDLRNVVLGSVRNSAPLLRHAL